MRCESLLIVTFLNNNECHEQRAIYILDSQLHKTSTVPAMVIEFCEDLEAFMTIYANKNGFSGSARPVLHVVGQVCRE
jgi:hypothetical protein